MRPVSQIKCCRVCGGTGFAMYLSLYGHREGCPVHEMRERRRREWFEERRTGMARNFLPDSHFLTPNRK